MNFRWVHAFGYSGAPAASIPGGENRGPIPCVLQQQWFDSSSKTTEWLDVPTYADGINSAEDDRLWRKVDFREDKPLVEITSLRASLWTQVYVKSMDLRIDSPSKEADAALDAFDAKFAKVLANSK